MKEYLQEIYDEEKHDGFIFILDENEDIDISAFTYKEPTEPVESHESLGYKYHIITYRETVDGEITEPDMFEAILGDPCHYASTLLRNGFFGTICKKTKNSLHVVNEMYNDLIGFVNSKETEV